MSSVVFDLNLKVNNVNTCLFRRNVSHHEVFSKISWKCETKTQTQPLSAYLRHVQSLTAGRRSVCERLHQLANTAANISTLYSEMVCGNVSCVCVSCSSDLVLGPDSLLRIHRYDYLGKRSKRPPKTEKQVKTWPPAALISLV